MNVQPSAPAPKRLSWCLNAVHEPPEGVWLETKMHDSRGVHHHEDLRCTGTQWERRDGANVYYRPTHWLHLDA